MKLPPYLNSALVGEKAIKAIIRSTNQIRLQLVEYIKFLYQSKFMKSITIQWSHERIFLYLGSIL